jgi:hypothetical protein
LEGILTDVRSSQRLIVSVTMLQRSVAVEIDSALVSALSSFRPSRSATSTFRNDRVAVAV